MKNSAWVLILSRIGLASVFLYAAIAGTINPINWVGYLPQFLTKFVPADLLLKGFDLYELVIALWLLSGKKVFIPATLFSLTMLGIIFLNLNQIDITFRDIGLFFMGAALALATF